MRFRLSLIAAVACALIVGPLGVARGAEAGPQLVDPNLRVQPVVEGLELPTSIAFVGPNNLLVLEKNSGRVKHVVNGVVQATVLDLAVNNSSERGLLGIALHPDFPSNPGVYLFWTCKATAPPINEFFPDEQTCSDANMFGGDSENILQVPLLANRIDRFTWDGSALNFDKHLITLRAFQNDGAPTPPNQGDSADGPHGQQPPKGNHDGGVIAFGPDGKLYAIVGDTGRRGQLQNLPCGPTATTCPGPSTPDDQFGGPQPDDAHFTGMILRLNDDGSAPTDNPFYAVGASMDDQEVGHNLQKVFAYGIRNSFGMAFDPISGALWEEENGEDAFDELNRVERGMNGGWIQIMGPVNRIAQYKGIETTSLHEEDFPNLQQFRWGPERIADSPAEALSRLFMLPGARNSDPEFAWKNIIAIAGLGFIRGRGLGPNYASDMLLGTAEAEPLDGVLLHFNLTGNRRAIGVDDRRLADRVADNLEPQGLTESESLLFGTGFGITTDIETAPDGSVYVVSLDQGTIYRISRRLTLPPTDTLPGVLPGTSDIGIRLALLVLFGLSGAVFALRRFRPAA